MSHVLNPEQQKAVDILDCPVMVIAGAGTGKTTVLTEKVKNILAQDLAKPSEILALTFTEKAAREMEERIEEGLPYGYVDTWISTFHSFGEQVLRQDGLAIGINTGFRLLTQAETQLFIKQHFDTFDLEYYKPLGNPTKFLQGLSVHFSRLQDEDVSPKEYLAWAHANHTDLEPDEKEKFQELAHAYQQYTQLKLDEAVMDFGDLIRNCLELFRQRPDVLKKYQDQFKYIVVDEYQDTNFAQTEIVRLLAQKSRRITVFLDDDQSIYRFRGAAVYNAMSFRESFPETITAVLTQNYRSIQQILDVSYQGITHNNPDRLEVKEKIDKRLKAARGTGLQPKIVWEERVDDEAEHVATEIIRLVEDEGYAYKDVAILVRANNHAAPFVHALERLGVPNQFLGPTKLYSQPVVKGLIALYRFVVDVYDDTALYALITNEHFHIDRKDIAELTAFAKKETFSLFNVIGMLVKDDIRSLSVQDATKEKLVWFYKIISSLIESIPDTKPGELLYSFLHETGLIALYKDPSSEKIEQEILYMSKFFDTVTSFEVHYPDATVADWLEYLEFVWDQGESPLVSEFDWTSINAVNILTVHASKGLEFPVVFVVNTVNDRFPSRRRSDQIPLPEDLTKEPLPERDVHVAEERRLFYVALTRAKDRLYVTGAKFYGAAKRAKRLSTFVHEAFGEDIEPFLLEHTGKKEERLSLFDWDSLKPKAQEISEKLYEHESRRIRYLTYSQIDTFDLCPLHYKLLYIMNVPTRPSGSLSFGTTLHNTLKSMYQRAATWDQSARSGFLGEALALYEQHWIGSGFASQDQKQKMYSQGKKWIQSYVEHHIDWDNLPIALEKSFTITIDDLKINGRMDRVDRLADGTLEIIDYKTGQPKDHKVLQKDLQLSIYAMAATSPGVFGQSIDALKLSYFYFQSNEKVSIEVTNESLQADAQRILAIRDAIETSDFTCSNHLFCLQGCDFDLFCNRNG